MKVTTLSPAGPIRFEPDVFADERGYFYESWHEQRYRDAGIEAPFVQDNAVASVRGVLRGLHFQWPAPQGKLVSVLAGSVYDVALDIRPGSPTFGQWSGVVLSEENRIQLYLPPGFAHGYQVTSPFSVVSYKCTEYYHPECESVIAWDDPELGIEWPVPDPVLSPRDRKGLRLANIPADRLWKRP